MEIRPVRKSMVSESGVVWAVVLFVLWCVLAMTAGVLHSMYLFVLAVVFVTVPLAGVAAVLLTIYDWVRSKCR